MREQRSRKLLIMGHLLCAIVLCCALTGTSLANIDDDTSPASLQGTWRVTVLAGTPGQFFSLMQFNKGGTVTEVASTPGHTSSIGVWERIQGHDFAATFELFQDTNSDGLYDKRLRVRLTLHLIDNETLTGSSTVDVLTLDGETQVAGPFSGLSIDGKRMKVIPE
jgi:hypothetical protein